jgi:hypothetical protein
MLWNGNEFGKRSGSESIKAAFSGKDYDRSETNEKYGIFQLFG